MISIRHVTSSRERITIDHYQVDKRSLIIFPAVSILFNAAYWVHFLLAR